MRDPRLTEIMAFFEYEHLPPFLKTVSQPICEVAKTMDFNSPDNEEKIAGLRHLLEAKDCFVRAALPSKTDTKDPSA